MKILTCRGCGHAWRKGETHCHYCGDNRSTWHDEQIGAEALIFLAKVLALILAVGLISYTLGRMA